jgi:hypothetical protein
MKSKRKKLGDKLESVLSEEKKHLLWELNCFEQKGVVLPQRFTMESNIEDIRFAYHLCCDKHKSLMLDMAFKTLKMMICLDMRYNKK